MSFAEETYKLICWGDSVQYEELIKLIPKDKFDMSPIPRLLLLGEEDIKPILPELLFWMADMNWPIAESIVHILLRFPKSLVPLIKERLKPTEDDDEWKYFIITALIPRFSIEVQRMFVDDLLRIVENPTDSEKDGAVWEAAKRCKSYC